MSLTSLINNNLGDKGRTLPIYSYRNLETLKKFHTSNNSQISWGTFHEILNISQKERINHSKRELELKSSDALVSAILHREVKINRGRDGKPFILNSPERISISHTRSIVGVIINSEVPVAIDIESTNRSVGAVKQKFTDSNEIQKIKQVFPKNPEIFIWSCKECLFKILPFPGVHFKEHLKFEEQAQSDANIDHTTIWRVNHPKLSQPFMVNSFIFEDLLISFIDTKYI